MSRPAVTVDCPTCGRKTLFTPENRWRPFCSQRCKSIDLGAWAAERYRIAGPALDEEPGSGASDERAHEAGREERAERPADEREGREGRAAPEGRRSHRRRAQR